MFTNLYWYKGIRRRKWRFVNRDGDIVGKPSRGVIEGKVPYPYHLLMIEDINARKLFGR